VSVNTGRVIDKTGTADPINYPISEIVSSKNFVELQASFKTILKVIDYIPVEPPLNGVEVAEIIIQ
jgi:hypothetical protein